ncbi:hypothetical protein [Xanthocytophaga flava]|uniref:hypothetical protein n=1 Tax=Xanthocytophaga flava TaxID=3048013 RepID=UPI0028D5F068|nr:hypothetical protein [Xanthocytophaga flavus]MDJ1472843.1 hypothetical protein [Xanthocytophaga flavus]
MSKDIAVQNLDLNKAQLRILSCGAKEAVFNGPRGVGKSTGIAWLVKEVVEKMPRSSWGICGNTYMGILTRTLPTTVAGLEKLGYIKDVHFFVGRRAPEQLRWPMPLTQPLKFDHFIHFYNGTGFHLISQDKGGGSARGLSLDGVITDEALMINKEQFDQDVVPTLRANLRRFGHIPFHKGQFHFTSMPYGNEGKWIMDFGNYYERQDNYDFIYLRNEIIKLQLQFLDNPDRNFRIRTWEQLQKLEKECVFYRQKRGKDKGKFYMEASAFDNLKNLGLDYYTRERAKAASEFTFQVEYLGKRTDKIEGGFYPYLSDLHRYSTYDNDYLHSLEYDLEKIGLIDSRADSDCIATQELWLGADWGSKINCLSIGQTREYGFDFINAMFVKTPQILDDVAKNFCNYYKYHLKKVVNFVYDHTGNTQMANSKLTYAEQFTKILEEHGWTVYRLTEGAANFHNDKYMLLSRLLKENDPHLPKLRFNKNNCKYLLISMDNAPARDGKNGIEKVKTSEKSTTIPQETATHFSDSGDLIICHLYGDLLDTEIPFMGNVMG